jgi:glucoamylase
MEAFADAGGMLPEQIWDGPDMPARELFFGKASGSAMPLVWAHAEHIKLCRSLHEGTVFDMPAAPVHRYIRSQVDAPYHMWRFNSRPRKIQAGKKLRVEVLAPAQVHWHTDDGATQVAETKDTTLGVYIADLPVEELPKGSHITLTFYWPQADKWEGRDFEVEVI